MPELAIPCCAQPATSNWDSSPKLPTASSGFPQQIHKGSGYQLLTCQQSKGIPFRAEFAPPQPSPNLGFSPSRTALRFWSLPAAGRQSRCCQPCQPKRGVETCRAQGTSQGDNVPWEKCTVTSRIDLFYWSWVVIEPRPWLRHLSSKLLTQLIHAPGDLDQDTPRPFSSVSASSLRKFTDLVCPYGQIGNGRMEVMIDETA